MRPVSKGQAGTRDCLLSPPRVLWGQVAGKSHGMRALAAQLRQGAVRMSPARCRQSGKWNVTSPQAARWKMGSGARDPGSGQDRCLGLKVS